MSDKFQQLSVENNKLRSLVNELQQRVLDVELKQKSINSVLNLVQSGRVEIKGDKPADIGINVKKMAEPLFDWLRQKPVDLSI